MHFEWSSEQWAFQMVLLEEGSRQDTEGKDIPFRRLEDTLEVLCRPGTRSKRTVEVVGTVELVASDSVWVSNLADLAQRWALLAGEAIVRLLDRGEPQTQVKYD